MTMVVDVNYRGEKLDDDLILALRDMTPVMAKIEQAMVVAFRANFSSESAAADAWAPLAQATIEDRLRYGYGVGPILQRSESLRIVSTSVARHGRNYAAVGYRSGHPYANTHQFGRAKVPARPWLVLSEADASRFKAMIIAHLMNHNG